MGVGRRTGGWGSGRKVILWQFSLVTSLPSWLRLQFYQYLRWHDVREEIVKTFYTATPDINFWNDLLGWERIQTRQKQTRQEQNKKVGWGGGKRTRTHRHNLSSISDKLRIITARTHARTHTVMLTNNPSITIIINVTTTNNSGDLALRIFIVTTVFSVHWPIKVTSRENPVSCPVRHRRWRLRQRLHPTCTSTC